MNKLAYSYLRFSTPEQAGGDSRRRQLDLARAYAARHGLVLDAGLSFRDLGMSAFHGRNVREGALRAFLDAVELGLAYAQQRRQFARPLLDFPRVAAKLGWMAVETMLARQLTWFAARAKDSGRRCDLEAGMAKLLAARVAWSNADCALQIHGGNGYALEYPISRVLCDARILSIFEGAAEIQAQVIARGMLGRVN